MKKRVNLNVAMGGHKAGSQITLEFKGDLPVDRYWRDRFLDVAIETERAKSRKQSYKPSIEVADQKLTKKVNSDAQ
jgi:hypothetical protein